MNPYTLHHGDCLEVLRTLPDASVDAVVCDPPYGLSFMGKRWDYDVPAVEVWAECLRVLKPGGHLLAFAGTRTQHRMAVRIEDAGFEIRDLIAWVYGSGFPKSLDVSKAIDDAAGAVRERVGEKVTGNARTGTAWSDGCAGGQRMVPVTSAATDAARQWSGWGTALKPALEPITVARKPLDGTVAENVLAHGTGALNVDGCRIGTEGGGTNCTNRDDNGKCRGHNNSGRSTSGQTFHGAQTTGGRWPANLIHDGSEEVVGLFPQSEGMKPAMLRRGSTTGSGIGYGSGSTGHEVMVGYGDAGSAARFFYCAKASKQDRDEGLDGFDERQARTTYDKSVRDSHGGDSGHARRNTHPTVKPTDLMRYLCRLVTRPGGIVLDPFMGSGSTGKAAVLEGFGFVGIEREADYLTIARARIEDAVAMRARETAQLTLI